MPKDPVNQKIIAAQFSPDSKLVVLEILEEKVRFKLFASRKVQLRIIDINSGQQVFDASNILENQFSFSPDTRKFAFMPKGQSIWDAFRNKTEIQVFEVGAAAAWRKLFDKDVEKEFDSNFVSKVVFSSDNKMLASEDRDTIKVWDADNGKQLYEHKLDLGTNVSSFVFVPQTPAALPFVHWSLPALRTGRNGISTLRFRQSRTVRHEPQLNLQRLPAPAINYLDTRSIDPARGHEIIFGAICSTHTFALTSTIGDNEPLSAWIVL